MSANILVIFYTLKTEFSWGCATYILILPRLNSCFMIIELFGISEWLILTNFNFKIRQPFLLSFFVYLFSKNIDLVDWDKWNNFSPLPYVMTNLFTPKPRQGRWWWCHIFTLSHIWACVIYLFHTPASLWNTLPT